MNYHNIEAAISRLYKFVEANHTWNERFQDVEYISQIGGITFTAEENWKRLQALLHHTLLTQAQPRMTAQAQFWRSIHKTLPESQSMSLFIDSLIQIIPNNGKSHLIANSTSVWKQLFLNLSVQPSWGDKTAALFVKNVYNIHNRHQKLRFWPDTPTKLTSSDTIYLPVDKVIIEIFRKLGFNSPSFKSINHLLINELKFSASQMILWDDLWFWGFFTQRNNTTSNDNQKQNSLRSFGWNSDKYWSQIASDKSKEFLIRDLAMEFLSIIDPHGEHN